MMICLRDYTFKQHGEDFDIAFFQYNRLTTSQAYLNQSSLVCVCEVFPHLANYNLDGIR